LRRRNAVKNERTVALESLLAICLFLTVTSTRAVDAPQQAAEVPVYFVLHVRDYNTGIAVMNLSVEVSAFTDFSNLQLENRTNETGDIQTTLGSVANDTIPQIMTLESITLSDNYSLIKIQNTFIEETPQYSLYNAYGSNHTDYYFNTYYFDITFSNRILPDKKYVEGTIWVLKGKLVKVLDADPITGEHQQLIASPAILTGITVEGNTFWRMYFFPIGYEVTIYHETQTWQNVETEKLRYGEDPISPLTVEVKENTTLIDWMGHAATENIERAKYSMSKEFEFLNSTGYALDKEQEEYNAINSLWNRVVRLFEKGEYASAFGGMGISNNKFLDLMKWLQYNNITAVFTAISVSFFAYGLGSLLSYFVFDEPSQNKLRLITKVVIFFFSLLMISLSHPSLKITFAMMIGSRTVNLPLSLVGCFVIGILTYFFVQLVSVRQKTMADLALQLGVRSLKCRRSRTLLTFLTITIIVSSAIVFVNIAVNRETRFVGQWAGTDVSGVIVEPDTLSTPMTEYDVKWIQQQQWCKELSYVKSIRYQERTPRDELLVRRGFVKDTERTYEVNIVCIDPSFMEKYFNMSQRVTGFWSQFVEGEPVVIVPSDFDYIITQDVSLSVTEQIAGSVGPPPEILFGQFSVIGTFDPQTAFSGLVKLDNTPLFDNPAGIVLVPLESIQDDAMTISEVTILVDQGYDPVDVAQELAYTFVAASTANSGGLSQKIVWSTEFSVSGLIPYMPPLFIAGLMVYTTMASVYEERKKEFSMLATLGLDPHNTIQVFLVEALLLGLMGTFIGFFGSYILGTGLSYMPRFFAAQGVEALELPLAHWSMPSVLVAMLTGVFMVFLGAYIPAKRAQGVSLMGREQKREMVGELITSGNVTALTLPIRESVQNSELLYTYIKETIGKFKPSLVDSHSVKGELYGDGTFVVFFVAMGEMAKVEVPCKIVGTRVKDSLIPVIQFPEKFRSYERIRLIVRDLEQYMIGFSAWKDMQLKMTIVREAPRRVKTLDETMAEVRQVVDQVKDYTKKLRILDGQRGKLSDAIYNEFREKYKRMAEERSKTLRAMAFNLESNRRQISDEIRKTEVEVERITTSYNLGETMEEEFVKTCGPLQARLTELRKKEKEMEEIFDFVRKPLGMEYT